MKKIANPFVIAGYKGEEYFCNREKENDILEESLKNGRDITLFSPRRLGKTGLIYHFFHLQHEKSVNPIYVDIYGTENFNSFINLLANAVLQIAYTRKQTFYKKAMELFGKIRPKISFNELTGAPQVSFELANDEEKLATLQEIFGFLESQDKMNIIAIDEFQQISNYPERNIEEILRSHIQQLNNTQFIFSGSQRHMLIPMFSDAKRPFYQSTGFLFLDKLDQEEYKHFILHHFIRNKQDIAEQTVNFILEWTKKYTFYTQYLCNVIFSKRRSKIEEGIVKECIKEIFTEREPIFYNYRKLLPNQQYKLLSAIGKEDLVTEPTGQSFIKKYNLSNSATVRKNLQTLIEKDLVFETHTEEKPVYQIYDVFLSRWFQWK